MTWSVSLVPPEAVKDMWPAVAPLLAPAIEMSHGRADLISVLQWLLERRYLLWIAFPPSGEVRAAFVTREARYPGRSMLSIDFCGGDGLHGWAAEGTRIFRSFAKDVGLSGVELVGRPGWQKSLAPYGWEALGVVVETNVGTNDGAVA